MNLTEEELELLKAILEKQGHDTKDSQDPKTGEDKQSQDPGKGEEEKTGKSINAHKYERDIANRDKRIAELEALLKEKDEGSKTEAQRLEELESKHQELLQQLENEKITSKLTGAGCINPKAAMALLGDYESDVDKLKENAPYLFETTNQASIRTGGTPQAKPEGRVRSVAEALEQMEK